MSIFTFDWAQIAYNLSPLASPWWAQANVLAGFGKHFFLDSSRHLSNRLTLAPLYAVFFFWIIAPAMYFTNTWYGQYLPILSSHAFDNTGHHYNVTRILTAHNTLDQSLYEAYSPLFLPIVFAISYGLSFASVCATLSHAFLYFRSQGESLGHSDVTPGLEHHHGDRATRKGVTDDKLSDNVETDLLAINSESMVKTLAEPNKSDRTYLVIA